MAPRRAWGQFRFMLAWAGVSFPYHGRCQPWVTKTGHRLEAVRNRLEGALRRGSRGLHLPTSCVRLASTQLPYFPARTVGSWDALLSCVEGGARHGGDPPSPHTSLVGTAGVDAGNSRSAWERTSRNPHGGGGGRDGPMLRRQPHLRRPSGAVRPGASGRSPRCGRRLARAGRSHRPCGPDPEAPSAGGVSCFRQPASS